MRSYGTGVSSLGWLLHKVFAENYRHQVYPIGRNSLADEGYPIDGGASEKSGSSVWHMVSPSPHDRFDDTHEIIIEQHALATDEGTCSGIV